MFGIWYVEQHFNGPFPFVENKKSILLNRMHSLNLFFEFQKWDTLACLVVPCLVKSCLVC